MTSSACRHIQCSLRSEEGTGFGLPSNKPNDKGLAFIATFLALKYRFSFLSTP